MSPSIQESELLYISSTGRSYQYQAREYGYLKFETFYQLVSKVMLFYHLEPMYWFISDDEY